ncbi:M3 family metallopeptidase [bacterium]|nr:M3 family metallopeptidase [bacterium]
MKQIVTLLLILVLGTGLAAQDTENPFFRAFATPFGVPDFDQIRYEHYLPAFQAGMQQQKDEIAAIVSNPEVPTFENTILALERSGRLLDRVSNVFFVLNGSMATDEMQEINNTVTPLLAKHGNEISMNADLFKRVKAVYEQKDILPLQGEDLVLLKETYKGFVRNGADLQGEKKERVKKINEELSMLTLTFGQHLLKENATFMLIIDDEADLAGLPQSVIDVAAQDAKDRGQDGKWVFTLMRSSIEPFLTYSEKRDLREKIYKGYINKGDNNNELDNKKIAARIAALRVEKATIMGYDSHADFVLEENMAKTPANVYRLLDQIWKPAIARAKEEAGELQGMIKKDGGSFSLQPWDWWYYAEKLKKEKYALDNEMIKPYFELNNVIEGVFYVANRLYGLHFIERHDIPAYHKDVRVYEVEEADGTHVGVLYLDYFARQIKRGGAWMNSFNKQSNMDGRAVYPVITNNLNLANPGPGKPVFMTFDQVSTLFHEFGHGLHGLLSKCTYNSLSGTSVSRDFVELPSQIMEHWCGHPDVLKVYAKHYQTGEPIPQELIDKIEKAGHFNQGFVTSEYLAACYLDLAWHTLTEPVEHNALTFENKTMKKIGLIDEITVRYRTPYFAHIFSGGYASGYYAYIWSEVLDCDAFAAFTETSLFDQKTAAAFRRNILEKGGTEDPAALYRQFRGKEPDVKYLLQNRGLN